MIDKFNPITIQKQFWNKKIPLDYIDICSKMSIPIEFQEFDSDVLGFIEKNDETYSISLRKNLINQNEVIAFLLSKAYVGIPDGGSSVYSIDLEEETSFHNAVAHRYFPLFLVPKEILDEQKEKHSSDLKMLFNTSEKNIQKARKIYPLLKN